MRISDWSSDVCSSDLFRELHVLVGVVPLHPLGPALQGGDLVRVRYALVGRVPAALEPTPLVVVQLLGELDDAPGACAVDEEVPVVVQGGTLADEDRQEGLHRSEAPVGVVRVRHPDLTDLIRSEEHTSELQSLMRISYAVFCLKK